ncbi:MAG TPA: hypothetical protein VN616_15165 [Puia sp.]|nr:hypothetical protein [Puia sp.]
MNTNTKNHAVKVIAVAFSAALFFFASPLTTMANEGGAKKAPSLDNPQVSVTFQGVKQDAVVFKVDYENPTGNQFWLIIKNDNGDVVYHQRFSDVHFSKTVFFQNTDTDINPTFVIRNGNSDVVRHFQVNKVITETTVVTGH